MTRDAAYRRLAITILGLDVATLVGELSLDARRVRSQFVPDVPRSPEPLDRGDSQDRSATRFDNHCHRLSTSSAHPLFASGRSNNPQVDRVPVTK
jgi:hypothetical protein